MIKNTAGQKIGAQLITAADGTEFTGSVTVYVTGDAGTQAAGSVSSGACTHEGHGYHTYAPAQAETNYDLIAFTFVGSGAITATVQLYTSVNANVLSIAGTSQTARDIGASVLLSSGTGTGQVKLSSGYVAPNWGDVGNPTTTVGLSGTTIKTATDVETDTQDIQSRLPAALTGGGNMKADALALSGDTTAADNAESFFDGTGYAGTNNVIPLVTTTTNLTNAAGAGDFTATMKTSIGTAVAASAVASVTAGVTLADDAITASKYDESTAFPVKSADTGSTQIARTGADGDTLETLSDQIDGVGGGSAPTVEEIADEVETRALILTSAYDAAKTAATQSSVDDIPTNSEMDTKLAAADDAVLAAIAALNNLSAAQVNTEVDTALADVGVTTTITGRIDAAISTRLASASYTAPDNSAITAIKAKTDPMTFTISGFLDVNTQYINDVQLLGDGAGTPMTHA